MAQWYKSAIIKSPIRMVVFGFDHWLAPKLPQDILDIGIFGSFGPFWTILDHFGPFWTCLSVEKKTPGPPAYCSPGLGPIKDLGIDQLDQRVVKDMGGDP